MGSVRAAPGMATRVDSSEDQARAWITLPSEKVTCALYTLSIPVTASTLLGVTVVG
ncbi:hypothetical protein Deipe_4315 (plasmid) [Deinococcus peraridilitoris DSM 19664]|uniref:Uncharacterized protein n=1 Tax=Deinococcus peraridilitoris (strain DSM 19664 / LMG 22246 / CIP 109416 / KR-200) TaxID=937777 RepID=L0A770_DEIPD|nr:hypothetical protein Deipe_4315 [Deinococcus peraridilitoris DSM 19664]